jgi:hypothetical protein
MWTFIVLVAASIGVSRYLKRNPERVSNLVRFVREKLARL